MTIRFHPPEDQAAFEEKVLSVLLAAALPVAAERLEGLLRGGDSGGENQGAEDRGGLRRKEGELP